MDGLMIDSEPLHYQAFAKVFEEFSKHFPQEDNKKYYIALSDIDEANDMVKRYQFTVTPEEIVERKKVAYKKLGSSAIVPKTGLIELLKQLDNQGYKKAIASSSSLEEIELVIKGLGINKYIDTFCSGEQVEHGKPAPDVYLLAASTLGVKPSECLVLEDAPKGIDAAIAAGMRVFAIPSNETKDGDFTRATRKLASLSDVFFHLQQQD